mgnify:CR=1 FL=1
MSENFCRLIAAGNKLGTVTSAMMYDTGFMAIDGITTEGKKFTITLSVKEEEENA